MENQESKFVLTSTRRALKFKNLMMVFCTIVFLLGLAASGYGVHSSYSDYKNKVSEYKVAIEKVEAEKKEEETRKKKIQAMIEEGKKETVKIDGKRENRSNFEVIIPFSYSSYHFYGNPEEPELLYEDYFVISVIAGLLWIIFLSFLYYGYWGDVCDAKDFIEFDGETGKCRFVAHFPCNRNEETIRVFDVISGVSLCREIFCKELNVGELTIFFNYVIAGEVVSNSWTLRYCDNITESVGKVQEFLRKRGVDAVKVNVVGE